jgi:hypothetical protein
MLMFSIIALYKYMNNNLLCLLCMFIMYAYCVLIVLCIVLLCYVTRVNLMATEGQRNTHPPRTKAATTTTAVPTTAPTTTTTAITTTTATTTTTTTTATTTTTTNAALLTYGPIVLPSLSDYLSFASVDIASISGISGTSGINDSRIESGVSGGDKLSSSTNSNSTTTSSSSSSSSLAETELELHLSHTEPRPSALSALYYPFLLSPQFIMGYMAAIGDFSKSGLLYWKLFHLPAKLYRADLAFNRMRGMLLAGCDEKNKESSQIIYPFKNCSDINRTNAAAATTTNTDIATGTDTNDWRLVESFCQTVCRSLS